MHARTHAAHTHKQQQHCSVIIMITMPVLDLALFKVNHYLPQRFTVKIIITIIATILLKYVFPLYSGDSYCIRSRCISPSHISQFDMYEGRGLFHLCHMYASFQGYDTVSFPIGDHINVLSDYKKK